MSIKIDAGRLSRAVWLNVEPVAPGRYLVTGGLGDVHGKGERVGMRLGSRATAGAHGGGVWLTVRYLSLGGSGIPPFCWALRGWAH